MTRVELKGIVRECVAEWFDRMKGTGEIPATKRRSAVARSQKDIEDRLWLAIRKAGDVRTLLGL
jgi:hypothetical protein